MSISVVLPVGALGASDDDDALDSMLRRIGEAANTEPGAWAEKYGTEVDNDVFMMHPFCWCERSDCPWCVGCECPPGAFHEYVDGVEVFVDEFVEIHRRLTAGHKYGTAEYEAGSREANRRRSRWHDPAMFCRYHRGEFGNAPNFLYKPTGFRVNWYKYIGRSTEVAGALPAGGLAEMERACLAALVASPAGKDGK